MPKVNMMSNMMKPRNALVLLFLLAVVGFVVYYTMNEKEHMSPLPATEEEEDSVEEYGEPGGLPDEHFTQNTAPVDPHAHQDPALKQLQQTQGACFPKDQLTPEELLPQDTANEWSKVNPSGAGSLKDRNFLQAGHNIGINTVGQTLRNANLQLRSEPPNPQVKVSPWMQSTIEPDVNRAPFEIGGCN